METSNRAWRACFNKRSTSAATSLLPGCVAPEYDTEESYLYSFALDDGPQLSRATLDIHQVELYLIRAP